MHRTRDMVERSIGRKGQWRMVAMRWNEAVGFATDSSTSKNLQWRWECKKCERSVAQGSRGGSVRSLSCLHHPQDASASDALATPYGPTSRSPSPPFLPQFPLSAVRGTAPLTT
jgi:hypothetical protein